jgi:hypothetical protein
MVQRLLLGLMLVLSVSTSPLLAQDQQDPLSKSELRRYVVTLALGDTDSSYWSKLKPTQTFTPAATRALADLKDFLPYKAYVPLDTVYLIGLNGPHQQLRGVFPQQHEFYMRGVRLSATATKIEMLRLWAAPVAESKGSPGLLIDTSFTIEMGETVVVGTSRLDGNRALILLVTAVK